MKSLLAIFSILLILLASSSLQATMAGSVSAGFCDSKCHVRCSKAGRQDRCLKYCGICCAKCHCVPSGTYGNKDECPCYRDWYTGSGTKRRPKCP